MRFVPCLLALAAMACAKGGGGSKVAAAGPEEPALNEGAFSVADFAYVDPYPADFHPLGELYFTAVRTDEVTFLVADTGEGWVRDDADEAYGSGEALPSEANSDCTMIDSVSGDLDGDGGPELVLLGSFDPGDGTKHLRVRVLTGGPAGWVVLGVFDVGNAGEDYLVGRLSVGDVDGDLRDEIVIAATHDVDQSWVRIFEDPVEGGSYGVLRTGFEFPGNDEVRAAVAQLDGDAPRELVIVEKSGSSAVAPVLDDALAGHAVLAADLFLNTKSSPAGLYASDAASVDLLIGDFDGDSRQEIAVYTMRARNNFDCWHEFFDDLEANLKSLESVAGVVQGWWSPYDPARLRRGHAADRDGDGIDEAIWLWTDADRVLATIEFHPTEPGGRGFFGIQGKDWVAWNFTTIDDDADGRYEVVLSGIDDTNTCYWAGYELDAAGDEVEYESGSRAVSSTASLALAGDDFERDGTRVRWTGNKATTLPDPMVILVAAAPPTKAGITQNYDATEASYSTSEKSAYSCETSANLSGSLTAGISIENVAGSRGFELKGSISGAVHSSTGSSDSTARTVEFTGTYDHDVVIFQGTLHENYEYEIVHAKDPAAIGTFMTINIPLDSKVYKWTREFFEERFGQDTILPAGLFQHKIGQPKSYPSHDDALALIDGGDGFDGDMLTVGQGRGSNATELELEEEEMSSEGWSWGWGVEAEVKLGYFVGGLSIAYESDHIFESTTSSATTYKGVVGDIESSADYRDWVYDTAVFIYQYTAPDELPFTVLDFWTDPWGDGYL